MEADRAGRGRGPGDPDARYPEDRYGRRRRHDGRAVAVRSRADSAGILRAVIEGAYGRSRGIEVTDDAQAAGAHAVPVAVVDGENGNRKITTADDLESASRAATADRARRGRAAAPGATRIGSSRDGGSFSGESRSRTRRASTAIPTPTSPLTRSAMPSSARRRPETSVVALPSWRPAVQGHLEPRASREGPRDRAGEGIRDRERRRHHHRGETAARAARAGDEALGWLRGAA